MWLFAAVLGLGSVAVSVPAAELPSGPHLVTSGRATVDATPDLARLSIEVSVSSKEAASAKKQVDRRVAQYFDFLAKNGIEKKDINAANLRTQPEYDYLKTGGSVLKGYRAVRQVDVTLRQLDKLNELLEGALKSGLNEIQTVELGVSNPDTYRKLARKKAIEQAISQAQSLASGFHTTLGPVYSIRYHVANYQPVPMTRLFKTADVAVQPTASQTYEQQTIHFDDQVDVVFELQRNP
ncbi:oxidative stress defense protein [Pectobacteriaceae bacterium CE70]|nr:oxidative stress defense protein [Pectobacteriaceae bacterium C52]WJV69112.1 oxidative stress defense protein [Pectobacteriaceae bacterium CE70]WJY13052.1 oxidative stress defense protein [Pectobacteriaceae bacterium C80]